jgi:hypothetical protein
MSKGVALVEQPSQPLLKGILKNSFAHTSPYGGSWLQNFYARHATDIYGKKVVKEEDFRRSLSSSSYLPEIMLMGNFIVERAAILSLCRELGINTVHGEDGFFPHYSTIHADPLGFCWESSLSRMVFRHCTSTQKGRADKVRSQWLQFAHREVPAEIKAPFVLWPLQLVGDKVNTAGLNIRDWTILLKHFRNCLPSEFQLVIKPHPRGKESDLLKVREWVKNTPNTILLPKSVDLKTLMAKCSAVAGANSTVLYEARLMFHKPVYVYGHSWFSNHTELFVPIRLQQDPRRLNRFDFVDDNRLLRSERLNDYMDWFLAQLLSRQVTHEFAAREPELFKQRVLRLSFDSFVKYGEEIFNEY